MNELLLALIAAVAGSLATFVTLRSTNRKIRAEGTDIIVGASVELVTSLTDRIIKLESQVEGLETKVQTLNAERTIDRELVGMLSQQLRDNGIKPVTRTAARMQLGYET